MTSDGFARTRHACFYAYAAMSSVFVLPPMLFVTFHETYGISYTLLGTLVLINFCTQLTIDLLFSFFSSHFPIAATVRSMPFLTAAGLTLYALSPRLFPSDVYLGLALGTVLFSVAVGLCEVLLSPIMAALPSENPERDMSALHSLYGWGVVGNVALASLFFLLFGTENWPVLTLFFASLPLVASIWFCLSPIPDIAGDTVTGKEKKTRSLGIAFCFLCIFCGSAAENAMTNWISGYMETALGVSKTLGDILGLALFAFLLASGRNLYAKFGKNILRVLLWSMSGAAVCYALAALMPHVAVCFAACVLTGIFVAMLWPGTLILMEERFPNAGVAAYALMAAGGDFGASVAPQLLGYLTDRVAASSFALSLGERTGWLPEQIGMKAGMLAAALFPLLGVFVLLCFRHLFGRENPQKCK